MRWAAALALILTGAAPAPQAADFAADAVALDRIVAENYAYADRLPGGTLPESAALVQERAAVKDAPTLLRYAEDRMASLADHHAMLGRSFKDSWAVVPTYADLWIVPDANGFVVDAVRAMSPAASVGIARGDRLIEVAGVPATEAVRAFWRELGLPVDDARAGYAARLLAAGRRDRPRDLTVARNGIARRLTLPSLYALDQPDRPPVQMTRAGRNWQIIFNNSLGDDATIAAFDRAMQAIPQGAAVTLDLTDTPSGGNTDVARAIMGWFVTRPTGYQVHRLVAAERDHGVARQWIEQVLPRAGKHHRGRVTVLVGRWTGSMGEGLAIGFDAMRARVVGGRMAGLLGAVYDFTLPASGIVVKLPTERLTSVRGVPREAFVPRPLSH